MGKITETFYRLNQRPDHNLRIKLTQGFDDSDISLLPA